MQATVNLTNARNGSSVSTAGDVNGDGFSDVVSGAPGAGTTDEGFVYYYEGSESGLTLRLIFESVR